MLNEFQIITKGTNHTSFKRLLASFIVIFGVTASSAWSADVSLLGEDEGYLLINLSFEPPVDNELTVVIACKGKRAKAVEFTTRGHGTMALLPARAARCHLSRIGITAPDGSFDSRDTMFSTRFKARMTEFLLKPDMVNYAGDWTVDLHQKGGFDPRMSADLTVSASKKAFQFLAEQYPEVAKSHQVNIALPKSGN